MAPSHAGGSLMQVWKEKQYRLSECSYSGATVSLFSISHMEHECHILGHFK